jgi:hypothetical protein
LVTSSSRSLLRAALALAMSSGAAVGSTAVVDGFAPKTTATTSAADEEGWGYAVVRHPKLEWFVLGPNSARDGRGTEITVERAGVGRYQVVFTGESPQYEHYGYAFATAIDTGGASCTVFDFGVSFPARDAFPQIHCFDRAGEPVDTKFSLNYLADRRLVGRAAYLHTDAPSAQFSKPDLRFSYNSTGAVNRVHRRGTGRYSVTLPGLGSAGGNVQVNNAGLMQNGACRAVGFKPAGADELVNVRCQDAHGSLQDATFSLVFTNQQGLKPAGAAGVAYLKADQPTAAGYTPAAAYRYLSNGATPRITHSATGRYVVSLPGMTGGGAAQVTGYGLGTVRCAISYLADSGTPAQVGVACNNLDGTPANSIFGLQYTH